MVRFGFEIHGVVAFICHGVFYKVRCRKTVASFKRQNRELPLYTAMSNAEQIEAEEFKEYRRIGVHVFCQIEDCEIPAPVEQEVATVA